MVKFEKLYAAYSKMVKYQIDKNVFDESSREDLFQCLWLRVAENIEKFENMPSAKERNYISVMTKNLIADYVKDIKYNEPIEMYESNLSEGDVVIAEVFSEPFSERIEDILNSLSDQDKALIYFKYAEEFKDGEVAQLLGCSHSAVRVRLHRLRNRIKQILINERGNRDE